MFGSFNRQHRNEVNIACLTVTIFLEAAGCTDRQIVDAVNDSDILAIVEVP